MSEALAPSRQDAIVEAAAIMQRLWATGSWAKRINAAMKVLCPKPYEWTPNRVYDVFKGRANRIDAHEMDHLRAIERERELEEARHELEAIDELRARLARLEAVLLVSDSTFHQPQIEALRGALRGLGGMVGGSGTGGAE